MNLFVSLICYLSTLYIQIFKMAAMLQQQYVVLLQNLEIGLPVISDASRNMQLILNSNISVTGDIFSVKCNCNQNLN